MNYNILRSLESPRIGGRSLVTSWQNRMTDRVLTEIADTVNGTVFIVQDRLWSQPTDERVVAIEGKFPADVEGLHDQFSLIFSRHPRSEKLTELTERFMAVTRYLAPGGFLMMDIEKQFIKDHATIWASRLYQTLKNVRITDTGHGMLEIKGVKRGGNVSDDTHVQSVSDFLNYAKDNDTDFPAFVPPFRVPLVNTPESARRIYFRSKTIDLDALAEKAASLPWEMRRVSQDVFGWKRPPVFPAMALRAKIYGALMASGVLGSLRLTSPVSNHTCIVRGDSRRVEQERDHNDEKQQVGSFESLISVLDLETGELNTYDPQKAGQVRLFLEEWAEPLAEQLQNAFPVAYDPIEHPYTEVLISLLRDVVDKSFFGRGVRNLSDGNRPSLTITQKHVLTAILIMSLGKRAVQRSAPQYDDLPDKGNHAVVLSGDPGSGKTFTSIRWLEGLTREYAKRHGCTIHTGGWPLSVVVTPPANVPGFEKSIRTASTFFATRVVLRVDDLHQVMQEAKTSMMPIIMIIPRTRMRQSQSIEAVYDLDDPPSEQVNGYFRPNVICPTCGTSVEISCLSRDEENLPDAIEKDLVNTVTLRGKNCKLCGEPLWQEKHNGNLYSLAKAVKAFARKMDIDLLGLVLDEVHEDGAPDSKQGQAMGWMSDIFAKVLGMSGTFYGGMASSNFHIFFRLFKWFRANWGLDESARFVNRYGNWRRSKPRLSKDEWSARVELPGVSPELISNYLINDIVYMSLQEAGFDLVPRTDYPVFVTPSADERMALDRLMADVKASVVTEGHAHEKKVKVSGSNLAKLHVMPSGFHLHRFATYSSALRCSVCNLPKPLCEHQWPIPEDELRPEDEDLLIEGEPVLDPEYFSAKETVLVDLVRNEAREGRPCLVYVYHTGKYALDNRLEYVFEKHGIRALNMAKVRPDKLEHKINTAAATGTDAIIVNPVRAGTGLNLIATPTVIFYQTVWSVLTMMQGAARSHRPTQTQPVRVYYMVTQGTVEEVILGRVIERMAAIFLASGGDNEGMAAVFDAVDHEETLTELLVNYVSRNVTYDLSSVFAELNSAQQDFVPTNQLEDGGSDPDQLEDDGLDIPDMRGVEQMSIF